MQTRDDKGAPVKPSLTTLQNVLNKKTITWCPRSIPKVCFEIAAHFSRTRHGSPCSGTFGHKGLTYESRWTPLDIPGLTSCAVGAHRAPRCSRHPLQLSLPALASAFYAAENIRDMEKHLLYKKSLHARNVGFIFCDLLDRCLFLIHWNGMIG